MTNLVEFGARTSIEYEARKWLIRMDGDEPLTVAEKDSLQEWMGRSPVHRSELTRLAKFWADANILTELAGQSVAAKPQGLKKLSPPSGFIPRLLLAMSAVLASVVATYIGIRHPGGTFTRAYETDVGVQKTVVLSDGSTLTLNTDSRVEVIYSADSRTIRLKRGEVHFSAAYDPRRIFQVQVGHSLIRALGTAFDIHVEQQTIEVIVTNGLVEVVDGANRTIAPDRMEVNHSRDRTDDGSGVHTDSKVPSVRLKAGEATSFTSGSGVLRVNQLTDAEIERRLSWQDGYLAFSGEPLNQVVREFNRYSTVKLEIGDPALASVSIGGGFRLGDVSGAIDLLKEACGVEARRVDATTIRLESRAKR